MQKNRQLKEPKDREKTDVQTNSFSKQAKSSQTAKQRNRSTNRHARQKNRRIKEQITEIQTGMQDRMGRRTDVDRSKEQKYKQTEM